MLHYVGLDVSLEQTNMCVLDGSGGIVFEGKITSTPEAIANCVARHAPGAVTVAFETGPLSTWHYHALAALGVPVKCLDARHARAALSLRLNNATMRVGSRSLCAWAGAARRGSRAWRAIGCGDCCRRVAG